MKNHRILLTALIFSMCTLALTLIGTSPSAIAAGAAARLSANEGAYQPWALLLLGAACVLYQGRRRVRRFRVEKAQGQQKSAHRPSMDQEDK